MNFSDWLERRAAAIFLWPAVILMVVLGVFPLLTAIFLAVSRIQFRSSEVTFKYVGWANFKKILFGSVQTDFWGISKTPTLLGWLIFLLVLGLLLWWIWRQIQRKGSLAGLLYRIVTSVLVAFITFWLMSRLSGKPGIVQVTLVYAFTGTALQYLFGLGLALLASQKLPGMRFFRVVFLLPMVITPVGVAYMFRMLAETTRGPFAPFWLGFGMGNFSWVNEPWGARAAVMIGDVWQWTPFMFIVLLAALQSLPQENLEAALVDGANRLQTFRYIVMPFLIPVSITIILIRLIEAFKIVDLPNVLTNGGPGIATTSMSLQSFFFFRSLDLGGAAATAFLLLLIVSLVTTFYATVILPKAR